MATTSSATSTVVEETDGAAEVACAEDNVTENIGAPGTIRGALANSLAFFLRTEVASRCDSARFGHAEKLPQGFGSTTDDAQPLAGQVVLVTGGARRLGRAICETLWQQGASIVIHYHRSMADAQALAWQQVACADCSGGFA